MTNYADFKFPALLLSALVLVHCAQEDATERSTAASSGKFDNYQSEQNAGPALSINGDGAEEIARQANGSNDLQIGMFYLIWHCSFSKSSAYSGPIFDMTSILQRGSTAWGPEKVFHWTGKPADGYYCLESNDALLKKHAEQLRDLGIDFVFVDATNQDAYFDSAIEPAGTSDIDIYVRFVWWQQKTFEKMLRIWSQVPNAPKVVPWTRIVKSKNPGASSIDFMLKALAAYPELRYIYQGKPLIFSVPQFSDPEYIEKTLAKTYTVRHMWAMIQAPWYTETFAPFLNYYKNNLGIDPAVKRKEFWSYQENCLDNAKFNRSGATIPCQQRVSSIANKVEQISVTPAIQSDWMSNKYMATSKFGGRTLRRQFETIIPHIKDARVLTVTGWNEWGAQRGRCPLTMSNCTGTNLNHNDGTPIFVDQFAADYNRDIEPGGLDKGWYVSEVKSLISELRNTSLRYEKIASNEFSSLAKSFHEADYLTMYPDVAQAVSAGLYTNGKAHFDKIGRFEGRNPNVLFSDLAYRQANPDVADMVKSGQYISGFAHYLATGQGSGKSFIPAFDEKRYLKTNADVSGAVAAGSIPSGLHHYLNFGRNEGREAKLLRPLLRHSLAKLPSVFAKQADDVSNHGYLDGATKNPDGSVTVSGWTCAKHYPDPIDVHVYVGTPTGENKVAIHAGVANQFSGKANESAISKLCLSTGEHFRFSLKVSANLAGAHSGKAIFAFGINPFGQVNAPLNNSGAVTMP